VTIQTQGPTKLLVDTIIETVVKVVLSGRSRITVCAANGVSCEGWLKVELLRGLVDALGSTDATEILPEAQNVDLTVRRASDQVLLELKTFPTNYGGGCKPITNFIDGVIDDLTKLSNRRGGTGIGLAIWLAYVVPEPVPSTWPDHLARIKANAAKMLRAERIPLWEKAFGHLYIMESK